MALVIDQGTTGDTGNAVAGADPTPVIASGAFGDSTVEITVSKDSGRPAPVYTFMSPGSISIEATGATITALVSGGTGIADIDVTIG